ncbi:MAG: peptidoglycan editing factor PgeF, partial [bacterium]
HGLLQRGGAREVRVSGPRLLFADNLRAAGVPHAFTTRQGGSSTGPFASLNLGRGVNDAPETVAANRIAVLKALGLHPGRHVEADQVHGSVVAVVGAADAGRSIPHADGLATSDAGLALAIHAADCVPLLLADPKRRVVAALHAGWRGTAAGIAVEGVRLLAGRFNSQPRDLLAAIGPSIGPCHYEVDEPVMERMRRWAWWPEVAVADGRDHWRLDLRAACRRQLVDAGVLPQSIEVMDLCTYDHPKLFYSYRRDRVTGRMAAVVAPPTEAKGMPQASGRM